MTDEGEENSKKDEVKTLFIDIVHFHSNRTKLFFYRHLNHIKKISHHGINYISDNKVVHQPAAMDKI